MRCSPMSRRSVPLPRRRGGCRRPLVPDCAVRELTAIAERIAKSGGTPLAVAKDGRCSA